MARTTFDLPSHQAFIRDHGDRVLWSRGERLAAPLCACVGNAAASGRPSLTCTSCNGTGITLAVLFSSSMLR